MVQIFRCYTLTTSYSINNPCGVETLLSVFRFVRIFLSHEEENERDETFEVDNPQIDSKRTKNNYYMNYNAFELDGESKSITNKKAILAKYAKEKGFDDYEYYVDDGMIYG